MENIVLLVFLVVFMGVISSTKRKYPEKWAKYDAIFKIIWSAFSIMLICFMLYSIWFMLTQSNAGMETKIFNVISTSAIILLFAVFTVSTFKKQK